MLVGVTADCTIQYIHAPSQKVVDVIQCDENNPLICMDFAATGETFSCAGYDGKVRLYDESTRKEIMTVQYTDKFVGHINRIHSLRHHPTQLNLVLTGGWDCAVVVHDIRVGHPVANTHGPYMCGDSLDVRGDLIIAGQNKIDRPLYTYDMRTMKNLNNIAWEANGNATTGTMCLQYLKNYNFVRSAIMGDQEDDDEEEAKELQMQVNAVNLMIAGGGGAKNEIKIFEDLEGDGLFKPGTALTDLKKSVYALDTAHDDAKFAFGTANGTIGVVKLAFEKSRSK